VEDSGVEKHKVKRRQKISRDRQKPLRERARRAALSDEGKAKEATRKRKRRAALSDEGKAKEANRKRKRRAAVAGMHVWAVCANGGGRVVT
jgi:hypothetical protein